MPFVSKPPGVYVNEQIVGAVPQDASHNRLYLIGTASKLASNRKPLKPYQVTSYNDFINQFGSSSALILNTVKYLFEFYSQVQLFYAAIEKSPRAKMEISLPISAGDYALTFSLTAGKKVTVKYAATSGDGPKEVIEALINGANNNTDINTLLEIEPERGDQGQAVYDAGVFYVRATPPNTLEEPGSSGNISAVEDTEPIGVYDWRYAINSSFSDDLPQGFLCCPEAFYTLSKQGDRTAVQQAMDLFAEGDEFRWVSIIDSGPPKAIADASAMLAERKNYSSSKGHSLYIGPWPQDSDNDDVSPACMQAALYLKRAAIEGFMQPLATARYPLKGLVLPFQVARQSHATLNDAGVNVIKKIPNRGTCVFGARTMADDVRYRFGHARVVLNVYERALYNTLVSTDLVFSLIDGEDVLFNKVKQVADALCFRFWEAQAFFGATPSAAFQNICDRSNNRDFDIQLGEVQLTSYVVLSPAAEKVTANIAPVRIGFFSGEDSSATESSSDQQAA